MRNFRLVADHDRVRCPQRGDIDAELCLACPLLDHLVAGGTEPAEVVCTWSPPRAAANPALPRFARAEW